MSIIAHVLHLCNTFLVCVDLFFRVRMCVKSCFRW